MGLIFLTRLRVKKANYGVVQTVRAFSKHLVPLLNTL